MLNQLLVSASIRLNTISCPSPANCQRIIPDHLHPPCLVLVVNLKNRKSPRVLDQCYSKCSLQTGIGVALDYLSAIKQVWKLRTSIQKLLWQSDIALSSKCMLSGPCPELSIIQRHFPKCVPNSHYKCSQLYRDTFPISFVLVPEMAHDLNPKYSESEKDPLRWRNGAFFSQVLHQDFFLMIVTE